MSIKCAEHEEAITSGSELFSSFMFNKNFIVNLDDQQVTELEKDPKKAFNRNFLRWMLSDGAAAAKLSSKPASEGLSLKIDFIEIMSYADRLDTCMYSGGEKDESGKMHFWRNQDLTEENAKKYFAIKQDVSIINNIVTCHEWHLKEIVDKYGLKSSDITYFLPHLSSLIFLQPTREMLQNVGLPIEMDRWFSNLTYTGNVGSAAFYTILGELYREGRPVMDERLGLVDANQRTKLKKGDRILCLIPESARFTSAYVMLSVV